MPLFVGRRRLDRAPTSCLFNLESSIRRIPQPPSQGQSGRFTWTVSVAPYAGAGGSLQQTAGPWMLHQLTVTVAWPPGRRIELATLRLLRVR